MHASRTTDISALMKSAASRDLSRSWRPLFVVALVAFCALVPALLYGIPSNVDLYNHYRFALPFYDSLSHGDLYPSWLAESNGGYGDPSFRFYPPGLYYLLATARALFGNWYDASLTVFILLSITGSLGAYFWARTFFSANVAMWAGVFYSLVPYRNNDFYQAFMLAEYAGMAVLPFAFAFVARICREGRAARDIGGLALSYAALILTHLPLTLVGSISLLVYALLLLEKGKRTGALLRLAAGATIGLAASACYWVTMLAELPLIKTENVSSGYRTNFLFQTFSGEYVNVWWMNAITVATGLMLMPAVLLLRRRPLAKETGRGVKVTGLLLLFALLMATPITLPLWDLIPKLPFIQFPWRWLTVVSMAACVMLAPSIPLLIEKARGRTRPFALLITGCVLLSLAFVISHTVREAVYFPRQQFESVLKSIPGSPSIDYWLPVWAQAPPARNMTDGVEAADREVKIRSWGDERRSFEISSGEPGEARVRTYFYPHWVATANGEVLLTRPGGDGELLISLPANAALVELEFREPFRTTLASVVTIGGWAFIITLVLLKRRRRAALYPATGNLTEAA